MIDAHQHFWQVGRFDYPWMSSDLGILYRDYLPYDLEPELVKNRVGQTVLVQASNSVAESRWLLELADENEFVAGVVGWVDLASEDVGLADPQALPLAVAAHHAVDFVGLPEAELTLAHATLYIATAPKSNSATLALGEAHQALKTQPVQTIPSALRSKTGQANKRIGQGVGYDYSHDFPENISGQDYLEKPLTLYVPKTVGWEAKIAERLARWKGLKEEMRRPKAP